jgi:peptide-methionine (R)-S-oxide reductase
MDKEKLKKKLTTEQFRVTQEKETEPPFSGKHLKNKDVGMYDCVVCGQPLFDSNTKFDSGTGWPSFTKPVNLENIKLQEDTTHGMNRTEVICKNCGAHLGHVFPDLPAEALAKAGGPRPGVGRYCINSCSLDFKKKRKG